MAEHSIVEYFNEHERYRCGYCGCSDTNYSHGMWAHEMTVQDYQDLIDRGWRRSGKYCYKPTMNVTCCPQYTIRCDAVNFKLSKSHKKVIKRVNRYLIHGTKPREESSQGKDDSSANVEAPKESLPPRASMEPSSIDTNVVSSARLPQKSAAEESAGVREKGDGKAAGANGGPAPSSSMETSGTSVDNGGDGQSRPLSAHRIPRPGSGPDPSKPPCQKARQRRLEKRLSKLSERSISPSSSPSPSPSPSPSNQMKSLEDFINEPLKAESCAHKLELKLIRSSPRSEDFQASFKASHRVYHTYQMAVHKDPPGKPNEKQYTRFLVDSPLEVKLVQSSPASAEFEASVNLSAKVFAKYQMAIHKEPASDCGLSSFTDFLVKSPLQPMHEEGQFSHGYGSFHLHYLLDGKIIAVGVIDILPHSVSSVYLYYDPEYRFLSLGTYSALREIMLVRELQKSAPDLRFYYMGFYIHSCPKMRYKGQYVPSFIVCPESYRWIPIETCRPKLDASRYARLDDCADNVDPEGDVELNNVTVLFQRQAMTYEIYKVFKPRAADEEAVLQYAKLVGKTCACRMLLFRK